MSATEHKKENLNASTIREYLIYLHSNLPKNPTAKKTPYHLPYEIKDNFIYQDDLVIHLQNISEHIGYYLLTIKKVLVIYYDVPVDGREKIFTCDPKGSVFIHENYSDAAGHYAQIDGNVHIITIHKKRGYKIKHLIGILVHEMMHHYLTNMNVRKYNNNENEILTDLACAYLGLGHLLLEAYSSIEWTSDHWERNNQSGHTLHRTWIGYITTEDLREAIARSAELRELNPREVLKSIISTSDRSIISTKLFKYRLKLLGKNLKEKVKKSYSVLFFRKQANAIEKCDHLIKLNFLLVKNLNVLAKKTDSYNIYSNKFEDNNELVIIVNSLAVGKFERELLELKSAFGKNFITRNAYKKLNILEDQISKVQKLFDSLKVNSSIKQ